MKAEINNENKAKFFALYCGQFIGFNPLESNDKKYVNHYFLNTNGIGQGSYLKLKPLSSISDEDAIEVSNIHSGRHNGHTYLEQKSCSNTVFYAKASNSSYQLSVFEVGFSLDFGPSKIIDFLRSKGYALPWMGLSVKEMIKAGWIKLVEL